MSQLSFAWPPSVSLEREDFFVSDANRAAFAMIQTPEDWPRGKLVLTGPEASGKSHLARVFAAQTGAQIIAAHDLPHDTLPDGPTVIEDADALPLAAEEWLFHLHNALAGNAPLLLTARSEPSRWPTTLPDLRSRMEGTMVTRIEAPDDALLTAVLMKLFSDRQIMPEPDLLAFLTPRLERSFAALSAAVEALDTHSLRLKRPVNRRLASDWLAGKLG